MRPAGPIDLKGSKKVCYFIGNGKLTFFQCILIY